MFSMIWLLIVVFWNIFVLFINLTIWGIEILIRIIFFIINIFRENKLEPLHLKKIKKKKMNREDSGISDIEQIIDDTIETLTPLANDLSINLNGHTNGDVVIDIDRKKTTDALVALVQACFELAPVGITLLGNEANGKAGITVTCIHSAVSASSLDAFVQNSERFYNAKELIANSQGEFSYSSDGNNSVFAIIFMV